MFHRAARRLAVTQRPGSALARTALRTQCGGAVGKAPGRDQKSRVALHFVLGTHREAHREEISFHVWLQWVVRTQLTRAQQRLREAGMGVGVVHDLAVGVHPGGADAWALGDVLAHQVSVGAPPDDYNQMGQDWSQPPWRPDRLAELGYAPFRDMLRTGLRMAGVLRVDHILGLFRLWWIPRGAAPTEGTYVRYDHEAMIGIVALEAHRAGAVVVGEDLGTAPPRFSETIMNAGILSYRLLTFERDEAGRFKSPGAYPARSLAAFSTHDLPTFAGWWRGLEFDVRECLGVFDAARAASERAGRDHERKELVAALLGEGLDVAVDTDQPPDVAALRYLARTPSALVAVQVLREGRRRRQRRPDCQQRLGVRHLPVHPVAGEGTVQTRPERPDVGRPRRHIAGQ